MREEQIQEAPVKVLLVGVDVGEEPDFERSMEELASLAEAAEKEVAGQMVQRWIMSIKRYISAPEK